jgi:site-specific recombinase XerD
VDTVAGSLRVLFGKGGYARTTGLDPGALAVLRRWMDARRQWGANGAHTIFCTRSGRPTTAAYVWRLLPRLGRKAGIEKRVHAHGLRHTHAAQLRSEGVDIGIISKQLGHRSIATTARYLDHIAPVAVVEAIRAREWV